jgi:hypothetical protein
MVTRLQTQSEAITLVRDALDPGPNGDYPFFPRDLDGKPLWGKATATYTVGDPPRERIVVGMPTGLRHLTRVVNGREETILIDLTPYDANGQRLNPPTIPGWTPGYTGK